MNFGQHILIFFVRIYRVTLSPVLTVVFGPNGGCRYTPSCSRYALEAIQTHGAISGSWMSLKRICRCNPFGGCGHDPAPPVEKSQNLKLKTSLHGS
jgi:putative membrane protein insertion efficiency factor